MRNAIKSLLKMKFIGILIIIQFSIGLYLINISNIKAEEAISQKNNLNRVFNFENTYLMKINTYNDEVNSLNPSKNYPKIQKTYDELMKMKNEGLIKNNFLYYGGGLNSICLNDGYKKYLPEKYHNMSDSELFKYASEINVNEEFYNKYKLNITSGRGFKEKDFKIKGLEENIPIIIGQDFSEFVKIGDKFNNVVPDLLKEDGGLNITYEVVGFYKHNDIPILGDESGFISNMYYSDALAIMPVVSDILWLSEKTMIAQYGIWINVNSEQYLEKVKERLNPILKEDDFSMDIKYIKNEYKTVEEMLINKVNNSMILGITLTFLSIIGISAILIGRINNRKKEFGVKIACGGTIGRIIYEVIIESVIMCILASTISLIAIYINYIDYLSKETIINNLIITTIIIIIVSILPVIKIAKLNVMDLVRGN